MAKQTNSTKPTTTQKRNTNEDVKDFNQDIKDHAADVIKSLNKDFGERMCYNFTTDFDEEGSSAAYRISTGSVGLDYIISNQPHGKGGYPSGRIIEIQGPTCHGKGDKVLRHDGTTALVEEVKPGDFLLGPDGKPRKVLEVHRGVDDLFEIIPHRGGMTYTVNKNHILVLRRAKGTTRPVTTETGVKRTKANGCVLIPVKDYIKESKTFRKIYKQEKKAVTSFNNPVSSINKLIEPYILGLLIGDGALSKKRIELTSADQEIIDEYKLFCERTFGYKTSIHPRKDNKAGGIYHLNGFHDNNYGVDKDKLRTELNRLGLLGTQSGDKFIPDEYKFASYKERTELLAGLMDTDGYCYGPGFEYISKSKQLAEDVAFVANSLGLFASVTNKWNKKYQTMYFRVTITGSASIIPTKLLRKQSKDSLKTVNHSLTGFDLRPKGIGEYFGFELDGDHLYLTNDFSVFHNSIGKSHLAYESIKDCQRKGGIVIYHDTEQTSVIPNLIQIGIDVVNNFIYVPKTTTEVVFSIMEAAIIKARSSAPNVPILVVLDSLAGCIPAYVAANGYDKETIGVQARVLSKCVPKINDILNAYKAVLIVINQQREKVGVMMGDPTTTPGGKTIPFFSSVRLRLYGGKPVLKKIGDREVTIGIEVRCKVIKNKLTIPFRETNFEIHFGKGVVDDEYLFDYLRQWCDSGVAVVDGKIVKVAGTGAWKTFTLADFGTGVIEKEVKFYKANFGDMVLRNPEFQNYMVGLLDQAYIMKPGDFGHATYTGIDASSSEETRTISENA